MLKISKKALSMMIVIAMMATLISTVGLAVDNTSVVQPSGTLYEMVYDGLATTITNPYSAYAVNTDSFVFRATTGMTLPSGTTNVATGKFYQGRSGLQTAIMWRANPLQTTDFTTSDNMNKLAIQFYFMPLAKSNKLTVGLVSTDGTGGLYNKDSNCTELSIDLNEYLNIQPTDYIIKGSAAQNSLSSWRFVTVPLSYIRDHGKESYIIKNAVTPLEKAFDWTKVAGVSFSGIVTADDAGIIGGTDVYGVTKVQYTKLVNPPTNTRFTALGESAVQLNWDAPATGYAPNSYNVYKNGSLVGNALTATSYTDLSAASTTNYTIQAYYNNGIDESYSIPVKLSLSPKSPTTTPTTNASIPNSPTTGTTNGMIIDDNGFPDANKTFNAANVYMYDASNNIGPTVTSGGAILANPVTSVQAPRESAVSVSRLKISKQYTDKTTLDVNAFFRGDKRTGNFQWYNTAGAVQFYYNPTMKSATLRAGLVFGSDGGLGNNNKFATMTIDLKEYANLVDSDYSDYKWKHITIPFSYILEHGQYIAGGTATGALLNQFSGFCIIASDERAASTGDNLCRISDLKFVYNTIATPQNLTTTVTGTTIHLNWAKQGTGNQYYTVYRTDTTGLTVPIVKGITATTYTDTNLTVGNSYTYSVQTEDITGTRASYLATTQSITIEAQILSAKSCVFTDNSNSPIANIGTNGVIGTKVNVSNYSGTDANNLTVILAHFKGNQFIECTTTTQNVLNSTDVTVIVEPKLTLTSPDATSTVRAFVWDGTSTLVPIIGAYNFTMN